MNRTKHAIFCVSYTAFVVISIICIWHHSQLPERKYEVVAEEIRTDAPCGSLQVDYAPSILTYEVHLDFKAIDCTLPEETQEYAYYMASANGIDFTLLMAIMKVESDYDPNALSKTGDKGLMQINKRNESWLKEEVGTEDLFDPFDNIHAGAYILAGLFDKYEDANKVLMAYNMGEAGAKKLWDKGVYETKYTRKVIAEMGVLNACD